MFALICKNNNDLPVPSPNASPCEDGVPCTGRDGLATFDTPTGNQPRVQALLVTTSTMFLYLNSPDTLKEIQISVDL